ncbi:MAG: hypothetical protein OEM62_08330 [Acidobacteriota bacterium]|nr:hypothetical protein [Acidobacteriota bacterium]
MSRNRWSCWMLILAAIVASPAAAQLRWFESYTGGLADESIKQDRNLTAALLISENMGPSTICVDFSNDAPKANKGKIIAEITISPADEEEDPLVAEVSGRVRDNNFFDCVEIDFLIPNDVIFVDVTAKKFKKMQVDGFFSTGLLVAEDALLDTSAATLEARLTRRQQKNLRRMAARNLPGLVRIER